MHFERLFELDDLELYGLGLAALHFLHFLLELQIELPHTVPHELILPHYGFKHISIPRLGSAPRHVTTETHHDAAEEVIVCAAISH